MSNRLVGQSCGRTAETRRSRTICDFDTLRTRELGLDLGHKRVGQSHRQGFHVRNCKTRLTATQTARRPASLAIAAPGHCPRCADRAAHFGLDRSERAPPALPCHDNTRGHHDPATAHRAVLGLSGAVPQGQVLSGVGRQRLCLRVGPAAVRSRDRRDYARCVRAAGRARDGAVEALSRDGRLVAAPCAQVQCLLHARAVALRDIQRGL